MQKSRFSKLKILGALMLCVCVFSCNEDDLGESRRSASGKKSKDVNSELTLAAAQQWYNQTQTPVAQIGATTRSGTSPTLVKPGWDSGKESNRGRYEVVETPLKTKGGHLLLDSETAANFDPMNPDKSIRNTARMVVMKDIVTGDIRSFIMIFVGSYDYLKTTKNMGRNSYLYREPDFDGSVLFYELDGRFINGWQYREGKIIASISESYGERSNNMTATRAMVEECTDWCYTRWDRICDDYSYWEDDAEWGSNLVVVGYCYDVSTEECRQHCTYYDDGSGNNNWNDPNPPGSVGPPSPPPTPSPNATLPSYSSLSSKFKTVANLSSPDVYKLIGGMVYQNYLDNPTAYANACALRLSYAFNMVGGNFAIPYISGVTGSGDANRDGVKEWYFYRVDDMAKYLSDTYGDPISVTVNDIQGQTGIIGFSDCNWTNATGHLDVWDGSKCLDSFYEQCDEIYFWKLK